MEPDALSTKSCSNDVDPITLEPWENIGVFIKFVEANGRSYTECFNKKDLQSWLNQVEADGYPAHIMSKWIPISNKPMYPDGSGGKASTLLKDQYWLSTQGQYIRKDDKVLDALNGDSPYLIEVKTDGIPIRLGRQSSILQLGGVHGQDPGYKVYEVQDVRKLQKKGNLYHYKKSEESILEQLFSDVSYRDKEFLLYDLDQLCKKNGCTIDENTWLLLIKQDLMKNPEKILNAKKYYKEAIGILSKPKGALDAYNNGWDIALERLGFAALSLAELKEKLKEKKIDIDFLIASATEKNKALVERGLRVGLDPFLAFIKAMDDNNDDAAYFLYNYIDLQKVYEVKIYREVLKGKAGLLLNYAYIKDELLYNFDLQKEIVNSIHNNEIVGFKLLKSPRKIYPDIDAAINEICSILSRFRKLNSRLVMGTRDISHLLIKDANNNELWEKILSIRDPTCFETMKNKVYKLYVRGNHLIAKTIY